MQEAVRTKTATPAQETKLKKITAKRQQDNSKVTVPGTKADAATTVKSQVVGKAMLSQVKKNNSTRAKRSGPVSSPVAKKK